MKRKILSPSPSPLITVKEECTPITTKRKKPSPLKDLDTPPKPSKIGNKPQSSTTKASLNMNALHDALASTVQALSAAIQPEPEAKIEQCIPKEEPLIIDPIQSLFDKELAMKNRKIFEMAEGFRKHRQDDQSTKNKDIKKDQTIVEKLLDKVKNFKKSPVVKDPVEVKAEEITLDSKIKNEPIDDEFWVEIKDPALLTTEDIVRLDDLIKRQKNENRKKSTVLAGFGDFLMEMPNKNRFPVIDRIETLLRVSHPKEDLPTLPLILAPIDVAPPIPPPTLSTPIQNDENSDSDSDSESRLVIEVNEPEEEKCKISPLLPCNPVDVAAKTAIQTIEENKDITIVRVEKKDLEQSIIQPPPPLLGMTTITPLVYQPVSGSSSPSAGRIFGLPTSLDFSDSGVKPIVDIAQISQDLIIQEKKAVPMNPETSLHSLPAETSIRPYLKKEIEVHSDSSSNQHSDSMKMLLCEETIPGSPSPVVGKDIPADIKSLTGAVLHPIESNIKHIPMDIESSLDIVKHEISMTAINFNSPHESQDDSCEDMKARLDMDSDISPRKRRRGYPKVMMVNDDTPAKKKKIQTGVRRGGEFFFLLTL